MPKRFRDLPDDEKAARAITDDPSDASFVYCPSCNRAMEQGDCTVVDEDISAKVRCAYGDCILNAYIAAESLQPWDTYRAEHEEETADWPAIPTPGECYKLPERDPRPGST